MATKILVSCVAAAPTEARYLSLLLPQEDGVLEKIRALFHRIFHYFETGRWVTEEACLKSLFDSKLVMETAEEQMAIQQIYGKRIAQRYPEYYALGGKMEPENVSGGTFSFLARFFSSPSTIGSIWPSSSFLAEKITKHIPDFDANTDLSPRHYLEIGPGTGPFTSEIIRKMRVQDSLELVEYDSKLRAILREKFGHLRNVTIHETESQSSIFTFSPSPGRKYNAIVSGLPHTVFTADEVQLVLSKYETLAAPGGWVSYMEYVGIAKLKELCLKVFGSQEDYENIRNIRIFKDKFAAKHEKDRDVVVLNLPPCYARHHQIKSPSDQALSLPKTGLDQGTKITVQVLNIVI